MSNTSVSTWEQSPPRRPSLDDVGGGNYANDTEHPPDPGDPNAHDVNQMAKQVVALAALGAAAAIHVTFSGGTPSIASVQCARADVVPASFSVTDNGAGDTSITHTGGLLPAVTWPAWARQVDDVEIDRGPRVISITNGWRIKTKLNTTGTDSNFVLFVSGL
jgi:hypothetical protein